MREVHKLLILLLISCTINVASILLVLTAWGKNDQMKIQIEGYDRLECPALGQTTTD